MAVFEAQTSLPVGAEDAFAWHSRQGALERLLPPWEKSEIIRTAADLAVGSQAELVTRIGPVRVRWLAEHTDCDWGSSFKDTQLRGPFARWDHTHEFTNGISGQGNLRDQIEYRLPGGILGRLLAGRYVRRKLDAMFRYRHRMTREDLAVHDHYKSPAMKIAITGSSGLVGQSLSPYLTTGGHQVVPIVRTPGDEEQVVWDPTAETVDLSALEGTDAVVHLAGHNIAAKRWNEKTKLAIRESRVNGTRVLCEALAKLDNPPSVLVTASAIGYYGDRGDERLSESSGVGTGFLPEVVRDWEEATRPATEAGIRVVNLRFGVILTPRGGALAKMLGPFGWGIGGRVGSGKQYWSWISIDDAVGAIHHALASEQVRGPVNVVAPQSVTNREFTKTLGRVLRRPTVMPTPAFAARLALGEMAGPLLLASARVEPTQLQDSGYEFRHTDLEDALRHVLGR